MTVRLVWAQARGGVIGFQGGLPWHLPEDLRSFKELTTGGVVVMGRTTWESLPERFRPLPERTNVVLTSRPLEGAETATSVEQVLERYPDVWVIGGAQVYAAFLPHADRIHRTDIELDVEGDTWAPSTDGWVVAAQTPVQRSTSGLDFSFTELVPA